MKKAKSIAAELRDVFRGIGRVVLVFYLPLVAALVGLHFPYDTDPSLYGSGKVVRAASEYYEAAYQGPAGGKRGLDYETLAAKAAEDYGIAGRVAEFARQYHLEDKKVLEVGSGRGYLQDVVADYTGLDISPSVAHHYHKKFVAGDATKMPFPDNSFDAVWSIWVFEHIAKPERGMREIRRVVKPGGKIYFLPTWLCKPWFADGFAVRPYSDFNWKGKLVKASLGVRDNPLFQALYMFPTRGIRWAQYRANGKETPLRFKALAPNYDTYWQADSDAAVNLDGYEAYLWFTSRGDTCLNCGSDWDEMTKSTAALVIQVNK